MLGSNSGRFRPLGWLACAMALAVAVACASSVVQPGSPEEPELIDDLRVERDEGATSVTLLGLEHPVFTAFHQQSPDRVVVDLASVEPARMMDPIAVYDGLVEEVSLAPFSTGSGESMTRVEVTLAAPADYEVVPGDDGLVIRVAPRNDDTMADAAMDDPWAAMPGTEQAAAEPMAIAEWEAADATTLNAVDVHDMSEGSLIELQANGTIGSAVTFTLENPDRLVVDLPGMKSEVGEERVEVGSAHAARVRIGQHADMVRVVVDGGEQAQPFDGRRIVPAPNGLLVALGGGADLDVAVENALSQAPHMAAKPGTSEDDSSWPAETGEESGEMAWAEDGETAAEAWEAPAEKDAAQEMAEVAPEVEEMPIEMAESASSGGPVTIYGIEFDVQEGRDRLVVLAEEPVDYLVYEPDAETLVVSIADATIDPEAAVRITPDPGGPVSLVTAFQQPDVEGSEVRVVVKRAPDLKPETSRRGSLLVMDFARDGAVAQTPPVLMQTAEADVPATEAAMTVVQGAGPTAVPADGTATAVPALATGDMIDNEVVPASLEPAAAIDILSEGGLMDGKEYSGRRISLDFKEVDIADVLRLIAEVSDLNVIAGDEVQGQVTIRLVEVPWDQALDIILLTKGLGFMRVGNVLRIAPAAVIQQEEEARLQEKRAKEKLEDLVVKLQPVNYANVKDIKVLVDRLLSPRGTVNTDERTNTLILKDIPSVIDEATALIKAIDTQTPQVMIEAKIVEASLDFSREFGAVWSIGAQPLVDGFDSGSAFNRNMGSNDFRFNDLGVGNSAVFGNPITAGPTALANLGAFILDEKLNLDLQLQAAEVNGDGKVISSPRIVTLDNSNAQIEQGVSIPFQTFENGDAQLEFVDAVLKLDVTPHITADKSIIMEIKVSRNAPDDSVFTLTGSPAIAKNQVDTETLVKDGQTLVLGGIYVVDKSQRQSRVPFLHQIPLLGALFRSNEISDSRKELLIFVTPRIVLVPHAAS